jgi:molybdopterin/thiamine biosynthesis adenylyltransferase
MASKFHHEQLYRQADLAAKLSHKITVCGGGALGSNLVDTLTRQGFSNIRVIDKDRIETHNLNTQIWSEADVGALKTEALKNKVFRNVGVELDTISKELTSDNAAKFIRHSALVIDCFDNAAARTYLQRAVRKDNIECLHGGMNADYGEVIWDPVYKVPRDVAGDVCDYPLARNLVMLVVAIMAEEIVDWCLGDSPRYHNWSVTLKDLAIRRME